MSKMLGIIGDKLKNRERSFLLNSINLSSLFTIESVDIDNGFFATSVLRNKAAAPKMIYESHNHICLFCGDIIGFDNAIDLESIVEIIVKRNHKKFADFSGRFAIVFFDKIKKQIEIVSDRRSQQPVYYQNYNHVFTFSSELATFCRLKPELKFNEKWLYDYFFFNHPILSETFLKSTYKMPPASVLQYNPENERITIWQYAKYFKPGNRLLEYPESFNLAKDAFSKTVSSYINGSYETACAITGGWDGRTLLSCLQNKNNISTYTYGVEGCYDLIGGKKVARKAKVNHFEIKFKNDFVNNLPSYMLKTVFLSSGEQKVLRSTLLYMYQKLTQNGKRFPIIISGIGIDGIFRGHSQVPHIVSHDVAQLFRKGKAEIRKCFWSNLFKERFPDFYENIMSKFYVLRERFGKFETPEHHLLYKLYLTHPEHFGGEIKIAENFTTIRVPAWDPVIIKLAFSINDSALSFSEFTNHIRGHISEVLLQAYVIKSLSPSLAKIPIGTLRPDLLVKKSKLSNAYILNKRIAKRIKNLFHKNPPLENWNHWLNVTHKRFIDNLIFSKKSLIGEYVSDKFLRQIKNNRDIYWIGKLATAEIIMRSINDRWQIDSILSDLDLHDPK